MTLGQIEIREARPEDAAAISALIDSLAHYFLIDPADRASAEPFFRANAPESLAETIREGRIRYHVAERGGELMGTVAVRDDTHLYHLFVAESLHRQGLGARLWETARAGAAARGNPGRFTVNSSLYAVPLYERLGFRPTAAPQRQNGLAFVPMELG